VRHFHSLNRIDLNVDPRTLKVIVTGEIPIIWYSAAAKVKLFK
jgi:hypothetical protein